MSINSTIQSFATNLQDYSYVNFVMIGYIFIIIGLLINVFVNNISFKKSIIRASLSLITLDLALIFVIFMHNSFFWILKWQLPMLLLIFVFSFGNKSAFFNVYRGAQERIMAFCMLVYVVLSYVMKMKTVNTLIVIVFILCEMAIFGLLKQIYNFIKNNVKEKIDDKKEEKLIKKQEQAREKEREARILEKTLNAKDDEAEEKTTTINKQDEKPSDSQEKYNDIQNEKPSDSQEKDNDIQKEKTSDTQEKDNDIQKEKTSDTQEMNNDMQNEKTLDTQEMNNDMQNEKTLDTHQKDSQEAKSIEENQDLIENNENPNKIVEPEEKTKIIVDVPVQEIDSQTSDDETNKDQ